MPDRPAPKELVTEVLAGKNALVVGIANEHSIAYGCARGFFDLGAKVAITYLNDKAKPYVPGARWR
jgi:enoyl-[acyl-carrier protein] reductase I